MKNDKNKNASPTDTLESKNVNPNSSNEIYSDVLGSYVGITEDGEEPIQDADDL